MNIKTIASIVSIALACGCSDDKKSLQVYTWSDYFDPELVEQFENANDCRVVFTTFDSNEGMYAKIKSGAEGYDIIVPSSYLIPTLVSEGIITQMEHDKMPNVKANFDHSIDAQVLDKDMVWSVPYACTYTGIMYDKKNVKEVTSWKVLEEKAYFRRISLLDDVRELVGIGLMVNGYSLNSTNETEIMTAAKYVAGIKQNVRKLDAEAYKNDVANGSIWVGHGYSSDAAQVIINDSRDDIGFSCPNDGFTIAWDEFVVLKSSKNKELAWKFIDFFNGEEVAYKNMLYICSLVPVKSAIEKMPEEYKPILKPENIGKGQLLKGFTDSKVMEYYSKAMDIITSTVYNEKKAK